MQCTMCSVMVKSANLLSRHLKLHCKLCKMLFARKTELRKHSCVINYDFSKMDSSVNGFKTQHTTTIGSIFPTVANDQNLENFLEFAHMSIYNELKKQLNDKKRLKYYLCLKYYASTIGEDKDLKIETHFANSDVSFLFHEKMLAEFINQALNTLRIDFYNDSCKFHKIIKLELDTKSV